MPHVNPPYDALRTLLANARTIAVVGASSDPAKPSHAIILQLLAAGYHVVPVNPGETEVLGQKAYPSLEAVPEPVDIVDVFRRAEDVPAIAESAVKIGAKALWLQLGIINDAAAALAEAGGLLVVMDKCIAVTHALLHIERRPG